MSTFRKILFAFVVMVIAAPAFGQQIVVPAGTRTTGYNVQVIQGTFQVTITGDAGAQVWSTCDPSHTLQPGMTNSITQAGAANVTVSSATACSGKNVSWTNSAVTMQNGKAYTLSGANNGDQIIVTIVDGTNGSGGSGGDGMSSGPRQLPH